jgi:hypothetical protein
MSAVWSRRIGDAPLLPLVTQSGHSRPAPKQLTFLIPVALVGCGWRHSPPVHCSSQCSSPMICGPRYLFDPTQFPRFVIRCRPGASEEYWQLDFVALIPSSTEGSSDEGRAIR